MGASGPTLDIKEGIISDPMLLKSICYWVQLSHTKFGPKSQKLQEILGFQKGHAKVLIIIPNLVIS